MTIHHLELWVPNLDRAAEEWGWLLGRLGYAPFQAWEHGRSWKLGATYLVVEQSPALQTDAEHSRLRTGMNHVAFHADSTTLVDTIHAEAPAHGWNPMFADRYPRAGGPETYAAYLENADGFEVELVVSI